MISAYPLHWPTGWPRTQSPGYPLFKAGTIDYEAKDVIRELELMKATSIVINSNMQYRQDGMPYTRQSVADTGVAVYFKLDGEEQCMPCDEWHRLEDNLRAVAKTVNALRGIERWGARSMAKAAFRGFKALPSESTVTPYTARRWHEVLEVVPTASAETIRAAYKSMLLKVHPDHGGKDAAFAEVQAAYKQGMEIRS